MEKSTKKTNKRDKDYEWLMFPQSYLTSVIILCDWFLKTHQHDSIAHDADMSEEKFFYKFHSPEYLIFPAIYNLKHGLELYLKSLSRLCDDNYNHTKHDLKELFIELTEKLKKYDDSFDNLNDPIKGIIEKYYNGTYVPFVFNRKKPDCGNQAERYPEHRTYYLPDNFVFSDKGDIIASVTPEIFVGIKNDAEKLYNELRKVQNILLEKKLHEVVLGFSSNNKVK